MSAVLIVYVGGNIDFNSVPQTVTIIAGTNSSTISIPVINDNIVEGNETFNMSLTMPSSLCPGITTGAITSATATIIDTSSELKCWLPVICNVVTICVDISVSFTQDQFIGLEVTGFVIIHFELIGGSSANPFSVTVVPSQQSPVSAQGIYLCNMCLMLSH